MAGVHMWKRGSMHGRGVHGEGVCVAGETATEAGGTHSTGMFSCCKFIFQ